MTLDEAIQSLRALCASSVKALNFSGERIGNKGAATLADALTGNTTLAALDLQANEIENEGAAWLAAALKGNAGLTELNLRGNWIGDAGAAALADALTGNATLVTLDVGTNKIGADGNRAIALALKDSPNLLWAPTVDGLEKTCVENRKAARRLMEKVTAGESFTQADIESLKNRLPSVEAKARELLDAQFAKALLDRVRWMICGPGDVLLLAPVGMEELLRQATQAQTSGRRSRPVLPFPVP